MNILIISPEPWEAHKVSKHHYARTLARRGHRVLFFGPPDETSETIEIEAIEPIEESAAGHLLVVRAPQVARGLRYYPAALRRRREAAWLRGLEARAGFDVDLIWLFENSRFFDMSFAGDRLKIYHQVDLNQDFQVAEALASSQIRLTTTQAMLQRFAALGSDGHKIDHGVAQAPNDHAVDADPRRRPGRPAAAYVGNLDIPLLDVSLVAELATSFPNIDFHLIGAACASRSLRMATSGMENVISWGRIDSSAIVPALRSMDVLLLTYLAEHHREQLANPHKLMEYMASGVVTVATYTEDYADKRHLLAMVDRREDFLPTFAEVVANRDHWNSPAKRAERQAFAADNTYDRQIERINALLHGDPRISARLNGRVL